MSERIYYVICQDNCKFESMTKEQIIAAIAEATGNTPTNVDAAFITKIKEQNANKPVKIWVGTQAEFNALTEKDEDTIYYYDDTSVADLQAAIENIINGTTVVAEAKRALKADLAEKAKALEKYYYQHFITVYRRTSAAFTLQCSFCIIDDKSADLTFEDIFDFLLNNGFKMAKTIALTDFSALQLYSATGSVIATSANVVYNAISGLAVGASLVGAGEYVYDQVYFIGQGLNTSNEQGWSNVGLKTFNSWNESTKTGTRMTQKTIKLL